MNTRRLLVLLAIICVVSFGLNTGIARAATYVLSYSGFSGTCSASGFILNATGYYNLATAVTIQGTTTLNGASYDTYSFGFSAGTLTFGTGFNRTFPTPQPTANWTFAFRSVVTAGGVSYWVSTTTLTCSGGSLSATNVSAAYVASFEGPGIPAGFVLKTITCNVAVYDAPGGKPVGTNAITGGQTWYVNPTPKNDAAGKSWTEIFVAGYNNGFVPTSCVH